MGGMTKFGIPPGMAKLSARGVKAEIVKLITLGKTFKVEKILTASRF